MQLAGRAGSWAGSKAASGASAVGSKAAKYTLVNNAATRTLVALCSLLIIALFIFLLLLFLVTMFKEIKLQWILF